MRLAVATLASARVKCASPWVVRRARTYASGDATAAATMAATAPTRPMSE